MWVLLGLYKVFDTINHDILYSNLHHYRIRRASLLWYNSYIYSIGCKMFDIVIVTLHHNNILWYAPWTSYQIRKIAGCGCAENGWNVFPRHRLQRKPLVSDPGMHRGTCVTHVSRTRGAGKTFPAFPAHAHPQFCVSGKRPIASIIWPNLFIFIVDDPGHVSSGLSAFLFDGDTW